jgi:putative nucleotidyltransferase with HDIG domain
MAELRNLPPKVTTILLAFTPGLRRRFAAEAACLSEGEMALARRMGRYDVAHTLRMARAVPDDPVLKRAALLHDIGKTDAHLKFVLRTLYTNLELFAPCLLRWIMRKVEKVASGDGVTERLESLGPAWKKAFYAQAHHAVIGGEMLERAGSDAEVIALVGGHQDPLDTYGARALRLRELDSSK